MITVARRPSEWERLDQRKKQISVDRLELCRSIEQLEDQLARIDSGRVKAIDRELIVDRLNRRQANLMGLDSELRSVEGEMTKIEEEVQRRSEPIVEDPIETLEPEELADVVSRIKGVAEAAGEKHRKRRWSA